MKLVIVTGMSGAGKSTAMKMLEDMGFFCIDNLPLSLLERFVDFSNSLQSEVERVAIGIDVRNGIALEGIENTLDTLTKQKTAYEILFLDAEDKILLKRYKETRRNHPLAREERVDQGIKKEREKLQYLKSCANFIIDTSHLLTRELREELENIFMRDQDYKSLIVTILSFGFKYGIPSDADIVMDVRFLPNPYYVEGLRYKTGNDEEIQNYVMQFEEANQFIDKLEDMVNFLIPNYISEGKNHLVIAIGCTGGKHRSVTLANELHSRLRGNSEYGLKIEHCDIDKDAKRGK